jgi:hypothetical protein
MVNAFSNPLKRANSRRIFLHFASATICSEARRLRCRFCEGIRVKCGRSICADRSKFSKVPTTSGERPALVSVNGLLGLAVLVLDVWCILQVMQMNTTNGTKVLWVVIILVLPVLGPLLWYLLGRK